MTAKEKFVLDQRRTREALHRLRLARREQARLAVIKALLLVGGRPEAFFASQLEQAERSASTWAVICRSWLAVLSTTRRELMESKGRVGALGG